MGVEKLTFSKRRSHPYFFQDYPRKEKQQDLRKTEKIEGTGSV